MNSTPPTRYLYVPKKSSPWPWIIVGILLVMLLGAVFFGIGVYSIIKDGEGGTQELSYPRVNLSEFLTEGQGKEKVVIIPVNGFIGFAESDGWWGRENLVERVVASLQRAEEDETVRAVILKIDSPGGGITAADVIHHQVEQTKAAGKKVVALLGDLATSGAYYLSCPADLIVAHPTTTTGSIGVIIQTLNFEGLMGKLGLKDVTIKSGPHKDLLSPFRDLTPEERAALQESVDECFGRFVAVVAAGRDLDEAAVRKLADGRIFTGRQALELKLVDEIGYESDAIEAAKTLAGIKEARVVEYRRSRSLLEFLRSEAERLTPRSQLSALQQIIQPPVPRLLYLWTL